MPDNLFTPNPAYPPGIQERDKNEQAKVVSNATDGTFDPAYIISNDPSAQGGTLVIKIHNNEFYAIIKPDKSWFSVLPRSVFDDDNDVAIEARLIITDRDGNDIEPGLRSRVCVRPGHSVKRIAKGK